MTQVRSLSIVLLSSLLCICGGASAQSAAQPSAAIQATEITSMKADMWSTGTETRAVFDGNVVVSGTNMKLTCDRLEITATQIGDNESTIPVVERFKHLLATGKVQIVQGDREATCGRAEVFPRENKIVLTENPMVTDHGNGAKAIGTELVLLRGERRVQGTNVRFIMPPIKDLGFDKDQPPPQAPAAPGADTAPSAEPSK
jgi:lipopolysaccharide export system protein LptA